MEGGPGARARGGRRDRCRNARLGASLCTQKRRGGAARQAGCACAPPPGAIKASPPAAASASSCREKPIHLLQQQLLSTWTLRPAPVLLVAPAPALAPASAKDANAPPARRVSLRTPTPRLFPCPLHSTELASSVHAVASESHRDRVTWGGLPIQRSRHRSLSPSP